MSRDHYDIIVVDDELAIRRYLVKMFEGEQFAVSTAQNGETAIEMIRLQDYDVALVDLKMTGIGGDEVLDFVKKERPNLPVIILTAHGSIDSAVAMMRQGAYDYITKPPQAQELKERVLRACRYRDLESENLRLKSEISKLYHYKNLVGSSAEMQKIYGLIERVRQIDASVLILGESGTGKEQVARAIHDSGARSGYPFVPVDCAAVSANLIESELFGHKKGAFTGAIMTTPGLLRAAGKGTIFLDEVGEIPLHVQASLLRTLQEREVRPVGSTERFPIEARIISATNRDLETAVKEGQFREDLYYRINVVQIKLPALRERRDDIPVLADFFLRKTMSDMTAKKISRSALKALSNYSWPGNIRELQNAIEYAMALCTKEIIGPEDLPEKVLANSPTVDAQANYMTDGSLEAYEKQAIINALIRAQGHRREAAAILKIGEATLYRKLKLYGLDQNIDARLPASRL